MPRTILGDDIPELRDDGSGIQAGWKVEDGILKIGLATFAPGGEPAWTTIEIPCRDIAVGAGLMD